MAVGDRFVRRHNAARTSTSNTTAADISYDTAVISETGYSWSSPEVTVTDAGLYLCMFDIGEVQQSGITDRSVGTLVPSINSTDQTLYKARHRYLRDSGGNHNVSWGVAILDLSASDAVKVRNPGAVSGTDSLGTYATNSGQGGGIQLVRMNDGNFTEVQRTTSQSPITITYANATRPWTDSTATWTQLTFTSEVRDDDGLYSGSGGDITLAANTKYLIVYGATFDGSSNQRHTHHLALDIGGTRVQHSTGYERNDASDGPPMQGMYLHETGGTTETLGIYGAVEQEDNAVSNTVGCDNAYLQVLELPSGAEWIHVDNGTTDALTTAWAGTTTYYDTPLSSTVRTDGDANLSLDSGNNAVQNDFGGTLPVLAIGWHMTDRDAGTSGTRKHSWTYWDNGGTRLAYGISGGYNRGQQGNDDTHRLGYVGAATMDLAASADLSWVTRDPVSAANSDMGVYAAGSRYFLGVQVLNLNTLAAAAATTMTAEVGTYSLSGTAANTEYHPETQGEVGTYALTGTDAGTDEIVPEIAFDGDSFDTESFDSDSFAVSVGAAAITMTAEVGTYSLSGTDANTEYSPAVDAGVGSYSLSGTDANTEYDRVADAEVGSYSLTGTDANTEYDEVTAAEVGSYSITGTDAVTARQISEAAEVGSYAITGTDANTEYNRETAAEVGVYALTGTDANTENDQETNAEVGTYSLLGTDAQTTKATVIAAGIAAYIWAGAVAATEYDRLTTGEVGSYALVGTDATTSYLVDQTTTADVGTYTLTGTDADTIEDAVTAAGVGSYTWAGEDASTTTDTITSAEVGAYTWTGEDAVTRRDLQMTGSAEVGSYTLTGLDATTSAETGFSYDNQAFDPSSFSSESFSIEDIATLSMTAEVGTYAVVGTDVATPLGFTLVAEPAGYNLSGTDANTEHHRVTTADVGSYTWTGQDVTTRRVVTTIAEVGSYSVTGTDANTEFNRETDADVGTYTWTGEDIATSSDEATVAEVGSYALAGEDATTLYSPATIAGVGTYSLLGTDADTVYEVLTAEVASYIYNGQIAVTSEIETASFDNLSFDTESFNINSFALFDFPVTNAEVGTYTLTGQDAATIGTVNIPIAAGPANYALTGTDAFLIPETGWTAVEFTVAYVGLNANSPFAGQPTFSDLVAGDICAFETTTTPSGNTVTMSGDGEFTISLPVEGTQTFDYYIYDLSDGNRGTTEQITVLGETVTVADTGAYSLVGSDAGLIIDEALTADQGVYALVGTDAITGKELSITIGEVGTYTLTGEDALTAKFGTVSQAEVGTYAWTGTDASVYKDTLSGEVGSYAVTGAAITTTIGEALAPVTEDRGAFGSVSKNAKGVIISGNRSKSLATRRRQSVFKTVKR